MYDFHMHSRVSFDSQTPAAQMVAAAEKMGLKEICFTDHVDRCVIPELNYVFDLEEYRQEYADLRSDKVKVRHGIEYGLLPDNAERMKQDLQARHYDFVIGSVHFVGVDDVYLAPYWEGKTQEQAIRIFLEETLKCVQAHDSYDVLGHLLFISKSPRNPAHALIRYEEYPELFDEILRQVACHDKGIEVNTSGVDRCGGYLPTMDFVRRFKELGGKIVTVGSDSHNDLRVGQYCHRAVEEIKEIFGYVCTFENRQPIFHK